MSSNLSSNIADAISEKMRQADLSDELQRSFLRAVSLAQGGDDGTILEADIEPITQLPDIETLEDFTAKGIEALPQAVLIKLNGGLGTSMGLARAKSLLPVKNDLCFLEVIAKQVIHLRNQHSNKLPLITMNSFRTESDTLALLNKISELKTGQNDLPFSFLQNKVPKLDLSSYLPASYPSEPDLEWCPPGHGDIYIALRQSGLLAELLKRGYRYAFISNADNLGANLDINLLGYFADSKAPLLMEVADRTEADKKGGHLARRIRDGRILLREVAQTNASDLDAFQNTARHKYFNTNSLWLNLTDLNQTMIDNGGVIPLPIIVNKKTINPTDRASTPVIQLESAMGAAIEVFPGAAAIRVPRSRFVPVKKTSDLLVLMSDLYQLDDSGVLQRTTAEAIPSIDLDDEFYANVEDFKLRFSGGVPSLKACSSLGLMGDVRFGSNVTITGRTSLAAPPGQTLNVENNATLSGD